MSGQASAIGFLSSSVSPIAQRRPTRMPRDDAAAQLAFFPTRRAAPHERPPDEEAAAIGEALLAQLRGQPLTSSQRALLAREASVVSESRAPAPVMGEERTLLSLSRGEHAEIRVRWRRYRGSAPFLDLRRFERGDRGGMWPTRQGVTVRAREMKRLLAELVALDHEPGC